MIAKKLLIFALAANKLQSKHFLVDNWTVGEGRMNLVIFVNLGIFWLTIEQWVKKWWRPHRELPIKGINLTGGGSHFERLAPIWLQFKIKLSHYYILGSKLWDVQKVQQQQPGYKSRPKNSSTSCWARNRNLLQISSSSLLTNPSG